MLGQEHGGGLLLLALVVDRQRDHRRDGAQAFGTKPVSLSQIGGYFLTMLLKNEKHLTEMNQPTILVKTNGFLHHLRGTLLRKSLIRSSSPCIIHGDESL